MHPSAQVANRILELAAERGISLTPMQLIKLVYIAHGWMLGLYQRPLIRDEVQAWKYGPVIPDLYKQVSRFKNGPVVGRLSEPPAQPFDEIEEDLIRQVVERYAGRPASVLSSLTHRAGSPWATVWDPDGWATSIPNHIIQAHYEQLAREHR